MDNSNSNYDRNTKFSYQGKVYDNEPSIMDRLKESFQTTDDRAKLEAIRRARANAAKAGIG